MSRPIRAAIEQLRKAVSPGEAGGLTDAELLRRWVGARDEAAFEVLLWRHGSMVLGVCRRLLRRAADVEDAFQATFLAFVRKSAGIRRGQAVGAWLYRVAYRVALRARASAPQSPAPPGVELPDPADSACERDLRAALDEEV